MSTERLAWLTKPRLVHGLSALIRIALGAVFLWSSLPKLRQPYDFLGSVYQYEMVGPKLGVFVATVLPWLEALLGVCLLGSVFVRGSLLLAAGLLAFFTFAQASVLWRGLAISCGCFGSSGELISYATVLRTALLFVAALVAFTLPLLLSRRS